MINIKVNPEAKRFMLQRLQRKPSHTWQLTGILMFVISMTTIWPVSQQFSPVSVYSPAHVCTCWVSEAQNMDMQSSGLDQVYKHGGVPVFVTGGLRCRPADLSSAYSAPAKFLWIWSWIQTRFRSLGVCWKTGSRAGPTKEPLSLGRTIWMSVMFLFSCCFSVFREILLLRSGVLVPLWITGRWNLWTTKRTTAVECSHDFRTRIQTWFQSELWHFNRTSRMTMFCFTALECDVLKMSRTPWLHSGGVKWLETKSFSWNSHCKSRNGWCHQLWCHLSF